MQQKVLNFPLTTFFLANVLCLKRGVPRFPDSTRDYGKRGTVPIMAFHLTSSNDDDFCRFAPRYPTAN